MLLCHRLGRIVKQPTFQLSPLGNSYFASITRTIIVAQQFPNQNFTFFINHSAWLTTPRTNRLSGLTAIGLWLIEDRNLTSWLVHQLVEFG